MAKQVRFASISLATKTDDGYTYDNFGAIIGNPEYPGSGSILLEIDHPERMDGDYPLRGRLVAAKFVFPPEEGSEESEEIVVDDINESFINVTFWKDIGVKTRK